MRRPTGMEAKPGHQRTANSNSKDGRRRSFCPYKAIDLGYQSFAFVQAHRSWGSRKSLNLESRFGEPQGLARMTNTAHRSGMLRVQPSRGSLARSVQASRGADRPHGVHQRRCHELSLGSAMGQVLHGCTTTTEAVRRAIQNSQESLRALAKR